MGFLTSFVISSVLVLGFTALISQFNIFHARTLKELLKGFFGIFLLYILVSFVFPLNN